MGLPVTDDEIDPDEELQAIEDEAEAEEKADQTDEEPELEAAEADEAADRWQREISQKELPAEIPEVVVPGTALEQGRIPAARLLQVTGLSPSSSEARRLISQGGVSLGEDKVRVETHDTPIDVTPGLLLWVGKKRVVRLSIGPN